MGEMGGGLKGDVLYWEEEMKDMMGRENGDYVTIRGYLME